MEHRAMIDAIEAGDEQRAQQLMRAHTEHPRRRSSDPRAPCAPAQGAASGHTASVRVRPPSASATATDAGHRARPACGTAVPPLGPGGRAPDRDVPPPEAGPPLTRPCPPRSPPTPLQARRQTGHRP
ncbi:hypothetical protein [Streptomyces sp. NPDC003857]